MCDKLGHARSFAIIAANALNPLYGIVGSIRTGGREDALTPAEIVREIAEGIKGARLDFIDDSGHLTPLEQPEKVNKIMKGWLL
jgi:pimeloyl-ACP methyl ester carboxylesterase